MNRVAYCVIPEAGGLFRFYRNLRQSLRGLGWEVLAPCVGRNAAARWDGRFADDGCVLLAPREEDQRRMAEALARWIEDSRIDILVPMDDSLAASVVPHLGCNTRLVTRCSSSTAFAYRTCVIGGRRLQRVVATTPRQYEGLSRYRQALGERLVLIPHGVNRGPSGASGRTRSGATVRLLYLGRLDDSTKGILWLPDIAARLARSGVLFQWDVVGDGPDRGRLAARLGKRRVAGQVALRGAYPARQVAAALADCDVLVLPSRLEGAPNVLFEAMASGVVPVASRIRGVTDFIVEHGVNGMLCRIGDTQAFARAIAELAADRHRLARLSAAARQTIQERFALERMGHDYERVFREVLSEPAPEMTPRPWSEFRIDPAYVPGWRRYVPRIVKDALRRYLF